MAVKLIKNNIIETFSNQFQTGTEKLNIQKQWKYLGKHLTENFALAYHLKEQECLVEVIIQSCIFILSGIDIANK